MITMVGDTKGAFNHCGNASLCPNFAYKAVRLGSLFQECEQSRTLVVGEFRDGTRWVTSAQCLYPSTGCARNPATDSTLGDSKGLSHAGLTPAELMQFPGAQATTFLPVLGSNDVRHSRYTTTDMTG
jgi:hypothetical protein